MGNEDKKALKQNVASMHPNNNNEIEINGGAGEIGKKIVKVAQWKTKCKSYFNRYYKTSNIIMVPSDGDTIMKTLSSLSYDSKGRGFVFKNYDIAKHLEFLGYAEVSLRTNLGVKPTAKHTSYIAYVEQKNVMFICEKVSKSSNINHCLKNVAAMVKYFLTLYDREVRATGVTVIGLLIRENGKQEELVECRFCHLFSPLYELFESSAAFKNWLKLIENYEGWWNLTSPKKQNKLFDELVPEMLCFMALQEKGLPTLTDDKRQQLIQTYFLFTPQQMDVHFSDAKHVVIQGSYGSGKTLLGLKKLEIIWKGLKQNEKIIYINFDCKSHLHFLMEKYVKQYVGVSSRKIMLTTGIQDIVESPGKSIYVYHNSAGQHLSAILQEIVTLNMRVSKTVKTNSHLIIEEYDGETLCLDEAAKITQLVERGDLIESNIILLAQPLMKNRIWKIGKKSSQKETCMFHELKNTFKIVKLKDVLRCSNEICRITKCTQNFVRNKDSVYKTKMDEAFEQRHQPEDKDDLVLHRMPEPNYEKLETFNNKVLTPRNESTNFKLAQQQQLEDIEKEMVPTHVPEPNYMEVGTPINEKFTNPGWDSAKADENLYRRMVLDQAFKRSADLKKINFAKSKIVSKFEFLCEPRLGLDIEGSKPNLVEFAEDIKLTSDMAVMALALTLKNFIDKNESTAVLHMADKQPTILRKTMKLLPQLLDETFSYTQDITVYLNKSKESNMILYSDFCGVNGMEFDHVVIVVSQSEYYLKYYLPQAISRCTYDLTFVLLPKDKTNNKHGFLQKFTSAISKTRNDRAKETVANITQEFKHECLVKEVTVVECKACENSCDCYSISNWIDNKLMFEVHSHSDQYKNHLLNLKNCTELKEEPHGSSLADAK